MMIRKTLLAALLLTATHADAQTYMARQVVRVSGIVDGSDIPDKSEYVENGNFSTRSGWTLVGGSAWATNSVSINGSGKGVSQTITGLRPGASYTLTFHIRCTAGVNHVVNYRYAVGSKSGTGSQANATVSVPFVAEGGSMPITIAATSNGDAYAIFSVSVVKN